MGRVYLGREYTPAFWPQVKSDPFGNDGVGSFGVAMSWAGFRTPSAVVPTGTSSRTSNTVGYKSPSFGGLTVNAATGLGEGAVNRDDGFNVEYAAGPIYAALAYERVRGFDAATTGNNLVNLAFHYDLGVVKPIFYYARAKTGVNNVNSNKYFFIGALAPIGGGALKAGYGRLDPQGTNNTQSKLGLGYDYPLSKRTNLYADVGWAKEDQKTNNSAYAVGIKHTF